MLNNGKEIQSLLGVNCGTPIFLTNTLFLQFCLWFLSDDQKYFLFENRHDVYQWMKHYCVDLMNRGSFNLSNYPAFHSSSFNDVLNDKLRLSFLTDILVKCNKTSSLELPSSSLLDSVLGSITHILRDITSIKCDIRKYYFNVFKGPELVVDAALGSSNDLNIILKHYTKLINEPSVHFDLHDPQFLTEKILCSNVRTVYLTSLKEPQEIFETSTELSSHLTHLCLQNIENEAIMKRQINQLADATTNSNLSNLSHLSIFLCNNMEGKLSDLFKSAWPHLKHLDLTGTNIAVTDVEFLSLACNGARKTLPNLTSLCLTIYEGIKTWFCTNFFVLPWLNLRSFHVVNKCTDIPFNQSLSTAMRENKLQNLTYLAINTMHLESLYITNLSNLKVLHLFLCNPFHNLQTIVRTEVLSELKLSSAYGLVGNVSSFITSSPLGQLTVEYWIRFE